MGSRLLVLVVILVCIPVCYSVSSPAYGQLVFGLQETTVQRGETEYKVQYLITGGSLKEIFVSPETATLTVLIEAESDGELQIQFPKNLMIESSGAELADMIVFVDEIEQFPDEEFSNCERILKVSFPRGAEQIDFVGTFLAQDESSPSDGTFPVRPVIRAGDALYSLSGTANADHCDFSFDQEGRLHIDLEGPFDRSGHLELRIPHKLLAGPYSVFINGVLTEDVDMRYGVSPEGESTTVTIEYIGACTQSIDIVKQSNQVDSLPASDGYESGQGGIFVENKPTPLQKRSLDLIFNVTHKYEPNQDSGGPVTRLHLELVDNCTNQPAQSVTFMVSIRDANATETDEPILIQDLFRTESGIINLDIVDDGNSSVRISGMMENFTSAWMPNESTDSVTIKTSAIKPEGSYRMDVQLYSIDNIRNIIPYDKSPVASLYWDESHTTSRITVVPEFPVALLLMTASITMAILMSARLARRLHNA